MQTLTYTYTARLLTGDPRPRRTSQPRTVRAADPLSRTEMARLFAADLELATRRIRKDRPRTHHPKTH